MLVFSGIDGAGKSTQIDLLKNKLEKSGKKVIIFWSRGGYTPGMEKLKFLLRKLNLSLIPQKRGKTKKREQSFSRPFIKRVWIFLSLLDLFFFYVFYLRFKSFFGYFILCDRYLIDTRIDFKLNFQGIKIENSIFWNLLRLLAKKPENHFILLIPIEESIRRSKIKNEPFPDTYSTLEKRKEHYVQFIKQNINVIEVDCMKLKSEIHNLIYKKSKL